MPASAFRQVQPVPGVIAPEPLKSDFKIKMIVKVRIGILVMVVMGNTRSNNDIKLMEPLPATTATAATRKTQHVPGGLGWTDDSPQEHTEHSQSW